MRTMFQLGFADRTFLGNGMPAGFSEYRTSREEIENDKGRILRTLSVPPGMSVPYPYMVKVTGEGEYWIKADGSIQFYSYKWGRWESPEPLDGDEISYRLIHSRRYQ